MRNLGILSFAILLIIILILANWPSSDSLAASGQKKSKRSDEAKKRKLFNVVKV